MDPYTVKERTSFWKPTENAPEMEDMSNILYLDGPAILWLFWGMDFFGRDPHRLNNRTFGDKVGSRIESLGKLYIAIEYKPFLNHSTTSTGDSCVFPATAFVGHVGHWYYKKMQYVLSVAQLAQT